MQISSSTSVTPKDSTSPVSGGTNESGRNQTTSTTRQASSTTSSSAPSIDIKADLSETPSSSELNSLANYRNIFDKDPTPTQNTSNEAAATSGLDTSPERIGDGLTDILDTLSFIGRPPIQRGVTGPGGAPVTGALRATSAPAATGAPGATSAPADTATRPTADSTSVDAAVSNAVLTHRLEAVRENPDDPIARATLRGATSSFLDRGLLNSLDPSVRESVLDELVGARSPRPEGETAVTNSARAGTNIASASFAVRDSENPEDRNSPEFVALRDQFRDSVNSGQFDEFPDGLQRTALDQLGITPLRPGERTPTPTESEEAFTTSNLANTIVDERVRFQPAVGEANIATEGYVLDLNGNGQFDQGTDGSLVLGPNVDGRYDRRDVIGANAVLNTVSGREVRQGQNSEAINKGIIRDIEDRDRNNDGVLSLSELQRGGARVWIDDNGDGEVSDDELRNLNNLGTNQNGSSFGVSSINVANETTTFDTTP